MNGIPRKACVGLTIILLVACSPKPPESNPAVLDPGTVTSKTGAPLALKPGLDIGDIEATVHINAILGEESKTPTVRADEMINATKELDMVTVDVRPPHPAQLWIAFRTDARKGKFAERPVVLHAQVFVDNKPVDSFAQLLAQDSEKEAGEYKVDVLAGLDAAPETLLVHAQAQVFFLPKGIDPASADIGALSAKAKETGNILSNPVRVNFASAEEAP